MLHKENTVLKKQIVQDLGKCTQHKVQKAVLIETFKLQTTV